MADHRPVSRPANLDIRDSDFPEKCLLWTHQLQSDMDELIAGTRATLAESRALLQEVDRLLALR
jgi:hypothetical protein